MNGRLFSDFDSENAAFGAAVAGRLVNKVFQLRIRRNEAVGFLMLLQEALKSFALLLGKLRWDHVLVRRDVRSRCRP